MIDLIRDQQVWTKNQIRKRSEAFIQQIQTHGDEVMLTRVNDAALLGLRPQTEGETQYLTTQYLPRAIAGGELSAQMQSDNVRLAQLIELQKAIADYNLIGDQLDNDEIPLQIDNEGELIDNPEYIAAAERVSECLAVFAVTSVDDWALVAQRSAGSELEGDELLKAQIRVAPTLDVLTVMGFGLMDDDPNYPLDMEKTRLLAELEPVEVPVDEAV